MIDWDDVRYFLAVARGGSVRAAADRLGVNHATVLVQTDGLNVLTDPVWSKRVSPLSWIGPARHRPGKRL